MSIKKWEKFYCLCELLTNEEHLKPSLHEKVMAGNNNTLEFTFREENCRSRRKTKRKSTFTYLIF